MSIVRPGRGDPPARPAGQPDHPDYDLVPLVVADTSSQLKALADDTRRQILDLVLERAASITELAAALGRPKGTVAYHVGVLHDAGLLAVVRTRRVRAVTERFYGRTGRTIQIMGDDPSVDFLAEAARERDLDADGPGFTIRHARIPLDAAQDFSERIVALAEEFTRLARGGDTVFGFLAGVYATRHPYLPPRLDDGPDDRSGIEPGHDPDDRRGETP